MVIGDRIKTARQIKGLTQADLADLIGINKSAIAQYETDRTQPTRDTLEAIALQTGYPPSWFTDPEAPHEFPFGSLLFRAHKVVSEKRRAQAHKVGAVVFDGMMKLAAKAPPAQSRLPRLDDGDPVLAAAITRTALGLDPEAPVPNVINAVERGGVTVIPAPLDAEPGTEDEAAPGRSRGRIDAYSLWADGLSRPVIVFLRGLPGDRLRLNIAHELGHLVLHQAPSQGDLEREAFLFAGAFLIPASEMRASLVAPITISDLARMKSKWGMSMAAIAYYASRLEIINERQLRYLYMQLGKRGWRKQEPDNLAVPVEKPRAFRKMAEVIYGDNFDNRKIAADTHLPLALLDELMDSFATRAELPRAPTQAPSVTEEGADILQFPKERIRGST